MEAWRQLVGLARAAVERVIRHAQATGPVAPPIREYLDRDFAVLLAARMLADTVARLPDDLMRHPAPEPAKRRVPAVGARSPSRGRPDNRTKGRASASGALDASALPAEADSWSTWSRLAHLLGPSATSGMRKTGDHILSLHRRMLENYPPLLLVFLRQNPSWLSQPWFAALVEALIRRAQRVRDAGSEAPEYLAQRWSEVLLPVLAEGEDPLVFGRRREGKHKRPLRSAVYGDSARLSLMGHGKIDADAFLGELERHGIRLKRDSVRTLPYRHLAPGELDRLAEIHESDIANTLLWLLGRISEADVPAAPPAPSG